MRCWEIKRSFVQSIPFSVQLKAKPAPSAPVGDGLAPSCRSFMQWSAGLGKCGNGMNGYLWLKGVCQHLSELAAFSKQLC